MSIPLEQIDNSKYGIPNGGYERYVKKCTHKHNRKKAKEYLRNFDELKPEPIDKQFKGWSI